MAVFWFVAGLLILLALTFLIIPLWRGSPSDKTVAHEIINSSIYSEQLAGLDAEYQKGSIDRGQYELSRKELEKKLSAEVCTELPAATQILSGRDRATLAVLLIALPLGAISLYWFTGNQQVWEALRASDEYNKQLAELKSITAQLVSRLESHPQDGEAWSLLGRAYMSQEEFPQAQRAFAKAYLLLPHNDPDLLADYAESIFMANDAHSTQLSSGLLYQALKLKPDHTRSLSLAGMAAYQANDFKRAIFYWQKLAKQVPDNSEMQSFLQSFIARAQTRINETANTLSTKIGKVAAIHVRVQIDPGLKAMISGSETLFVFAKAVGGPPMPFAVVRRTVRDLPLDVVLDDSTAMMPNARLSSFDQVIIGARVSASGTATPQKGDLEGTSGPVKVGGSPVRIVINRAVP